MARTGARAPASNAGSTSASQVSVAYASPGPERSDTILATAPSPASQSKWGAHLDLEGKLGNNRDLGEADVFWPLWQDGTSLVFGNIKARLDDNASREGNFGLAVRHMLEAGWNLGAYGYFDRRRTETHNFFSQATFGVEALSLDWDLRANWYAPLGRRTHDLGSSGGSGGASTASISGTTVIITTPGSLIREERSMTGFDAELGWRVPVFERGGDTNLRLYGGAYRFYADDVNPVQGPRGRVELTFDEVPFLWQGSRLVLGGEVQHDGPRGKTGFASARLRIPLQVYGESASRLTPLERRMADPIVRDIDIVAQTRSTGSASTNETATQTSGGSAITVIDGASFAAASLTAQLTTAGNNSTVLLVGTFNTTAQSSLRPGQTLMGAGTLTVQSASGKTATLTTSAATITSNSSIQLLSGANNATITGLTLTSSGGAGAFGIDVGNSNTISNNTITITATGGNAIGISVNTTGTTTISGNTITVTGNGANTASALQFLGQTVTVTNNTLSASGSTNSRHTDLSGPAINAGSTGNTLGGSNTGTCATDNSGTGFIGYTNAANCTAN